MGVSLEDLNKGVLDISNIIVNSMTAINALAGKTITGITAAQPAAPAAPVTGALAQSSEPTGLASIPVWVWAGAGALVLWRLLR
jgi:hypothetical protein